MMWPLVQMLYVIVGALITPSIVAALFAPERAWGSLTAPVPAFVVVTGTLLLALAINGLGSGDR